jgi:precorrin-3B methylase
LAAGSLTVVGTGFLAAAHTTPEALGHLRAAETLFYLVGDPVAAEWLEEQNPAAESLSDAYAFGKPRAETYREITGRILAAVRQGRRVCAAFYGHPGVFVNPSHDAVRQARLEGYPARMLPGISAEDCLFADLEVDPLAHGCQSFEATHFVDWHLRFDPEVPLILWQAGAIGVYTTLDGERWSPEGVRRLTETILVRYPANHPVTAYEAPLFSISPVRRETIPLERLPDAVVSLSTTLYVPALPESGDICQDRALSGGIPGAPRGSLVVVGTGYGRGQLTPEARICLERARQVLAFEDDRESLEWLRELSPAVRFLGGVDEPAREILGALARGGIVCAAFPGHPCLACLGTIPLRELLGRVRAAGHTARVYPGISWEDCLFADLGIDPATAGRVLFRAEDFPPRSRSVEASALLILLQGARDVATVYEPPSPPAPEGSARSAPVAYRLPPG